MSAKQQARRKIELGKLIEIHHRGKYGDYEDTYAEFEATYFGTIDGEEPTDEKLEKDVFVTREEWEQGIEPIPRFASIASDETYGMISLYETVEEAINDQAGIPSNGEYLNVPAGIVDLDTGKDIEYCMLALSKEAFAVVCGLVAPSDQVNHAGIMTEAWDELRAVFPLSDFRKWARSANRYNKEAGF